MNVALLFALWLMQFVNYVDRVLVGFAGPGLMAALNLDPGTFGVVLSSFALGYFLAQIPGGLVADRWGARAVVIAGPLLWALFTGLTGLVSTFAALVAVRLLFGVAEGLSNAAGYKIVGDQFAGKDRARAVSVWVSAFAIAPAVTGPAVGWLLASYGWREVFALLAVPAVLVAFINARVVPADEPAPAPERHAAGGGMRDALRDPALWMICGAYACWNVAYWGLLGWMPSYLALARHIDIKSTGMLSGLPYLFGLFGAIAAGLAGTRLGRRLRPFLMAGTYLLSCGGLYAAFVSETLPMSMAGLCVAGFFIYAGLTAYGLVMLDLAPAGARAAYAGVVSTAGQVGSTLAPAVIGYLVQHTGSFAAGFGFMCVALCIAAGCAVSLGAARGRRVDVGAAIPEV